MAGEMSEQLAMLRQLINAFGDGVSEKTLPRAIWLPVFQGLSQQLTTLQAENNRPHDLHFERTKLTTQVINEKQELQAENDKYEQDMLQVIDERDKAQDTILECAQLFGEQYEWVARIPGELPPDSGDLHEDLPCLIKELQAEKEKAGECPHCEGDGEIYVGSSMPEDDGHEQCITCGGEGRLPDADKIKALQLDALNYYYECEGAKVQLAERDDRITELEGELGRLEQELIDGVIALITTEQKAMRDLYQKHTYGINKVCNRLKIFVGDLIKPTQEPTNGS